MFSGILGVSLTLHRIHLAGHQYLLEMHFFFLLRRHERSMDKKCCLFGRDVGSELLLRVHGNICDRHKYSMNIRFQVLTVVLMNFNSLHLFPVCVMNHKSRYK
jgi:hypothetical protein